MPPSFYEYLTPTNPIAIIIVRILQYTFLFWCSGLLIYGIFLLVRYIQIRKNQDVQMLVDAQKDRDTGRKNNDQNPDPENVFREFCRKDPLDDGYIVIKHIKAIFLKGYLDKGSSVAKHIKAIFLAGWNENRLEVGELINHTTSNLLKWNTLFRSVLAVFIVLGLLGTLFGLTDSITELTPALNEGTTNETAVDNSDGMIKVLSNLFDTIKGAFAPSIWGIIFTISGVIIYGIFLPIACHPMKSILEHVTLTIWVPNLYPITSHASQIKEAASQMNSAANVLDQGFAERLGTFSEEFAENVTHLTGFQDEIRSLHQEYRNDTNQTIGEQTRNLEEILGTLKIYEQAYVESRAQIDETLQNFIAVATFENTSRHEQNRKWIEQSRESFDQQLETLKNQLKNFDGTLRKAVDQIRVTFDTQLNTLNDRLESFNAPLKESADQMRGTFADSVRNMREIVGELQRKITEQNESYEEQLTGVQNLNESIVSLLNQLDESSRNQTEAVNALSTNVNLLAQILEKPAFLRRIQNRFSRKKTTEQSTPESQTNNKGG